MFETISDKSQKYWQETKTEYPTAYKSFLYALNHLNIKSGEKVLDLGCGSGAYALPILNTGANYFGLDISKSEIESTRRILMNANNPNWEIALGDAHDIPLPSNSVDKVFCVGSFSNFSNQAKVMREIHRVLKEDGLFAVNIVNIIHWRYIKESIRAKIFYTITTPIKTCLEHWIFSEHLLSHIFNVDFSNFNWLMYHDIYPMFIFRISRFVKNNKFRIIDLQYCSRRDPEVFIKKTSGTLLQRLFCESIIIILQKTNN